MARILLLAGDAAESLEVLYPYQRLIEEGYEVQIAAPSKKKLQFVVHDFVEGYDTYTDKPGYRAAARTSARRRLGHGGRAGVEETKGRPEPWRASRRSCPRR